MKARRELTPEERAEAKAILIATVFIGILTCLCVAACLCICL